jgi:phage terminase Nu1 subunit (DNA packaging protein)
MQANLDELAEILGVARSTISAWVRDGMPAVEPGGTGKAWIFSVPECIEWWAENKRRPKRHATAAGDHDPDSPESYEEAERRKMVAAADRAELELLTATGQVVEITDVAAAVADMHVLVRTRLLSAGNKVRVRAQSIFSEDRAAVERVAGAVDEVIAAEMELICGDPFGEDADR